MDSQTCGYQIIAFITLGLVLCLTPDLAVVSSLLNQRHRWGLFYKFADDGIRLPSNLALLLQNDAIILIAMHGFKCACHECMHISDSM